MRRRSPLRGRLLTRLAALSCLVLGVACAEPYEFPAPDDWGELTGPGGPAVSFGDDALLASCSYLDGSELDQDHHNLVVMHDGYLVLPWAPEWSDGGLSFFEFDDPCAPVKVGEAFSDELRESHTMGFVARGERTYTALDYHGGLIDGEFAGGVQIWDVTDATAPAVVSSLALPGYVYPDAYARVSLATSWQGDFIWVSGCDNGFWVVDASDPHEPRLAHQYTFDPPLRVGAVHLIGDLAMVSGAEGARTVLMDASDPLAPVPFAGGEFEVSDGTGEVRDYYFANLGGEYALFARKESGGGFIAYDISDPSAPTWASEFTNSDGNGGYVFRQHDTLFVGESNFAGIYDFSDRDAPVELGRGLLTGDLDTATPVGNVVILAVDEDAVPDQASAVVPWTAEPDSRPPRVELHRPPDGALWVARSSSVGLSFDEMVELRSVFEGSFRVSDEQGQRVEGSFGVQENVVHFTPTEPLAENSTYLVTVPAGGIVDLNGNATDEELSFRFSTGGELL